MSTAAPLRSVPNSLSACETPEASGVARALARVQAFVKDHRMRWKDMPGGFGAFEKALHERVVAYEREMLAEEMAHADVNAEAIEVAGDLLPAGPSLRGDVHDSGWPGANPADTLQGSDR